MSQFFKRNTFKDITFWVSLELSFQSEYLNFELFGLLANLITGCETTLSVLYSQITTIFCTLHIFDLLKGQLISDHISPYYTNEKLTIFLTNRSTTDIL